MINSDEEFREEIARLCFQQLLTVAAAVSAQRGGMQINMTALAEESYRGADAMVDARIAKLDKIAVKE